MIIEDDAYPPVSRGVNPKFNGRWRWRLGKNGSTEVFFELFAPPSNIAENGIWWGFSYEARASSSEGGCEARD